MGAGLDGIIFDDLEWPPTRVSRSFYITSRITQKRCVLGTKLLKNTNRKPYTIYRMVQLSMTLSDLWPRFQGHDIFRHWISQKRHSVFAQKQVFGPCTAKSQPIWINFLHTPIVVWNALVGRLRPRSARGRLHTGQTKTTMFYNTSNAP